jgi:hypothetical protein
VTTEDIVLTHAEVWRAIVLTGSNMSIGIVRGNPARYRFGISSSSEGLLLCNNDLLIASETVYILANQSVTPNTVLAVTQN